MLCTFLGSEQHTVRDAHHNMLDCASLLTDYHSYFCWLGKTSDLLSHKSRLENPKKMQKIAET